MLNIAFAPMSLVAKTFNVGDKIKVTAAFSYTVSVSTKITLSACPYYISAGLKPLVSSCVGSTDVQLVATATPTPMTVDIVLTLVPKAQGGIENGTYGLIVWVGSPSINDFSLMFASKAWQDNIIIVTGNPTTPNIWGTIGSFMVLAIMLGMIQTIATPEGREKVKETVKEVIPIVISAVKAAA